MNVEAAVKALKNATQCMHSTEDKQVSTFVRLEEEGSTWTVTVFDEDSEPLYTFSGGLFLEETLRNALIQVMEMVKPRAKQLSNVLDELDKVVNPVTAAN
jgi:hypothetical protein